MTMVTQTASCGLAVMSVTRGVTLRSVQPRLAAASRRPMGAGLDGQRAWDASATMDEMNVRFYWHAGSMYDAPSNASAR